MAVQDNPIIIKAIYDSFNKRDFDTGAKYYDKNAEITDVPSNNKLKGPEGFMQFVNGWSNAFPDSKVTITNLISGGDWVAVEFIGSGTHSGTLVSQDGDVLPTNRKVELNFCDVYKLQNSKVTYHKTYYDLMSMLKQLGVEPEVRYIT